MSSAASQAPISDTPGSLNSSGLPHYGSSGDRLTEYMGRMTFANAHNNTDGDPLDLSSYLSTVEFIQWENHAVYTPVYIAGTGKAAASGKVKVYVSNTGVEAGAIDLSAVTIGFRAVGYR